MQPIYRCSNCGKVIDVTRDKYWGSTNLNCDPCYQSFPICEDLDEIADREGQRLADEHEGYPQGGRSF